MKKSSAFKLIHRSLLLGGVYMGSAALTLAQDASATSATPSLATLQQENQDLSARLKTLEDLVQKNGLAPSGSPVSAMDKVTVSGFVQASYFTDLENGANAKIPGYLWSTQNSSFLLNKAKVTLASPPAVRSGTDWSAAFRVSLMAGHDAPILNSSTSGSPNGYEYLREAYAEVNVPVGTGLILRAGELISLLNWESGDGGAANPNFSQGYQWYYTGNGPAAGVQADYAFTKWLDAKVRVSNGLYAGEQSTGGRASVMGSLGFTPTDKLWFNVIGFGGNGNGSDVNGASVIGGYQFTPKLSSGFEADDFLFRPNTGAGGTLWSVGGWIWYDFTPKVGVAFRAEYLDDENGMGISTIGGGPAPFGAGIGTVSPSTSGGLESFTFTLNLHPVAYLKIQPEFRVNHTSYSGGFNGKQYEYIIGCGATYSF